MPDHTTSGSWLHRHASHLARVLRRHVAFVGPGIVASVAYADPGNWATDLEAGSKFGYSLLFIVLLTGLFGIFIQVLACRLGCVTGVDLARHCRMLILQEDNAGKTTISSQARRVRMWCLLVPLYVINEVAIIATELAELTGSAIALNLLFPKLPLWAGVLVTSIDVFLILLINTRDGVSRSFEGLVSLLILSVLVCFVVLLVRVEPIWGDVFHGYIPSRAIIEADALYVSVGILGATVMPHAIVLGSYLSRADRLSTSLAATSASNSSSNATSTTSQPEVPQSVSFGATLIEILLSSKSEPQSRSARIRRLFKDAIRSDLAPFPRIKTIHSLRSHLSHASWDVGLSLICVATVINSAILIVAAAAFYYANGTHGGTEIAGIYDAFELLRANVGRASSILFAVSLLAAGQSASITVTLTGQVVSEGFIRWRTSAFLRRLATRLITVVPSLAVAAAVGRSGLDELLVASQVILSMCLPFILLPLLILTSKKRIMTFTESDELNYNAAGHNATSGAHSAIEMADCPQAAASLPALTGAGDTCQRGSTPTYCFKNSTLVLLLGSAIFGVIVVADVYVLYTTISGRG